MPGAGEPLARMSAWQHRKLVRGISAHALLMRGGMCAVQCDQDPRRLRFRRHERKD